MKSAPHIVREPAQRETAAEPSEIAALLHEVRALRDEIRLLRESGGISGCSDSDMRLALAIHDASRGLPFSAVDLVENAEIVFRESGNPDLRKAIEAAVGQVSARVLGRWISDREGRSLGGVRFLRSGSSREGLLWTATCETGPSLSRFESSGGLR